jgi:hypothetical protein
VIFWPALRMASTVCPICWSVSFWFMLPVPGEVAQGKHDTLGEKHHTISVNVPRWGTQPSFYLADLTK